MNLLTDPLPHCVDIAGKKYPIQWDYRTAAKFEMLIDDPDVEDKEKIMGGLLLFYPIANWEKRDIAQDPGPYKFFLDHLPEAETAILDFYSGWKSSETKKESEEKARAYSFKHDAALIFSSFLQQYGIDLTQKKLHWWVFQALLFGLQDSTPMGRAMQYRCMDTDSLPKEQRAQYDKLKRLYALPVIVSKAEREREEKLNDIWEHGGNLANVGK